MYLWTQKAEDDFRARHPKIKEKDVFRRAGHQATYDGQPLEKGEIQKAFAMRGWVVLESKCKKEHIKPKRAAVRKSGKKQARVAYVPSFMAKKGSA